MQYDHMVIMHCMTSQKVVWINLKDLSVKECECTTYFSENKFVLMTGEKNVFVALNIGETTSRDIQGKVMNEIDQKICAFHSSCVIFK